MEGKMTRDLPQVTTQGGRGEEEEEEGVEVLEGGFVGVCMRSVVMG